MKLEPFAAYLASHGVTEKVYVQAMPETVKKGALLLDHLSGSLIDHELPGFYHSGFQVIVRAAIYDEGEVLSEQISSVLNILNKAIGPYKVNYLRPRHLPIAFQRSKGNNFEFSVNFDACFVVL